MAKTLIHTILQKVTEGNTALDQFTDLNALLKLNPGVFTHDGGLGDEYEDILPHLTFNGDNHIEAIKEDPIIKVAQKLQQEASTAFLDNTKHKMTYKAGICFALVAVFSVEIPKQHTAYSALIDILKSDGIIPDAELATLCTEQITPIEANDEYHSTKAIIRTWQLKGKNDVQAFEEQRQQAILKSGSSHNLSESMLLLGLHNVDQLTRSDIELAESTMVEALKNIAGIDPTASENALITKFNEAKTLCSLYMDVKESNLVETVDALATEIDSIKDEEVSQESSHNELVTKINGIKNELQTIVIIANKDWKEKPALINAKLGNKNSVTNTYALEDRLTALAEAFVANLNQKMDALETSATQLARDIKANSYIPEETINQITDLSQKMTSFLEVTESANMQTLFNSIAMEIISKNVSFAAQRNTLVQAKNDHDETIKRLTNEYLTVSKEEVVKKVYPQTIQKFLETIGQINQSIAANKSALNGLAQLDNYSKTIAESTIVQDDAAKTYDGLVDLLNTNVQQLNDALVGHEDNLNQLYEQTADQGRVILQQYQDVLKFIDTLKQNMDQEGFDWQESLKLLEDIIPDNKKTEEWIAALPNNIENVNSAISDLKTQLETLEKQLSVQNNWVQTKASEYQKKKDLAAQYSIEPSDFTENAESVEKYDKFIDSIMLKKFNYIKQGKHNKARFASLERLQAAIDKIDANTDLSLDDRMFQIVETVRIELDTTAKSHHKIGFFGKYRDCRLQKVYQSIIDEYQQNENKDSVYPTYYS